MARPSVSLRMQALKAAQQALELEMRGDREGADRLFAVSERAMKILEDFFPKVKKAVNGKVQAGQTLRQIQDAARGKP